jgi:hypothetical protein
VYEIILENCGQIDRWVKALCRKEV